MNVNPGSEVVRTMRAAAEESWRKWREHVTAGTASSPEAIALWEEALLAARVVLDEVTGRDDLEAQGNAARAA